MSVLDLTKVYQQKKELHCVVAFWGRAADLMPFIQSHIEHRLIRGIGLKAYVR